MLQCSPGAKPPAAAESPLARRRVVGVALRLAHLSARSDSRARVAVRQWLRNAWGASVWYRTRWSAQARRRAALSQHQLRITGFARTRAPLNPRINESAPVLPMA